MKGIKKRVVRKTNRPSRLPKVLHDQPCPMCKKNRKMAKKVSYKAGSNPNQSKLGDENKGKRELCRFKDNCDDKNCPCHLFRMRL